VLPSSPTAAVWVLRSRRVVARSGVRDAAVVIRGETIDSVVPPERVDASWPVEDVGEHFVLPGLVDTHVHINEPGRTEWEGFATATRAAVAGGITTLVDMPLNSTPVTTNVDALARKEAAAEGQLWADCGFYGGIIPGVCDQVEPLCRAGVLGFKAFLCPSGIDEFPNVGEAELRALLPQLAASGLPLLVHAELPEGEGEGEGAPAVTLTAAECRSYARHLASRPRRWEQDAIALLIALCRETRCRVHVVHLASADALPLIAQARAEGLPLTVETCPHYLAFAAGEIPDGDPRFKCAPPIREPRDRDGLWAGLRKGLIDTIGSDHSPAPPERKLLETGDVAHAWGGIASLQLAVSAVWSEARRRGVSLGQVVEWMAARPAQLVGLGRRKGQIAQGFDADLVVFNADETFTVDAKALEHRHPVTPYDGRVLAGRVESTWLRGRLVFRGGGFPARPWGRILRSSSHDQNHDHDQAGGVR
jgi:allantoinase